MKINSVTLALFYLALIVGVAAILPNPTIWTPKYGSEHKDPLGTYVLFNELPKLFSSDIDRATMPVFNTLRNDSIHVNYLAINDLYSVDQLDLDYLLKFIAEGGNAFIAASNFSTIFSDTVGIVSYNPYFWHRPFNEDSMRMAFVLSNEAFKGDTSTVHEMLQGGYVSEFDSTAYAAIEVLGYTTNENVNFFRKRIGEGFLYINLCPAAFSNYELLYENTGRYVANCLSYLPDKALLFDDYYKAGKPPKASIVSVLLQHAPMQWAWNIALLSVILFLIFGARRKSRPIPILTPHQNDSLHYIETIGAMHFNQKNNRVIAEKRFQQMKNYLHRRFKIQEKDWHEQDAELFFIRTGIKKGHWQQLFSLSNDANHKQEWTFDKLIELSNTIDTIYSEIKS